MFQNIVMSLLGFSNPLWEYIIAPVALWGFGLTVGWGLRSHQIREMEELIWGKDD